MSLFDETRSVERPQFFMGQTLEASDLDGISDFHRAMRWLHNRSLHQVGIGNGLAVSGKRGDREVRVQPGYALDSLGREIVLLDDQVEAVPPVAGERDGGPVFYDLTVSYPSDADLEEAESRAGICRTRGTVRRRERPVFCWVRLKRDVSDRLRPLSEKHALDIQSGVKIVLARAAVRNCKLDADLSIAVRRAGVPPHVPRIVCGQTSAQWDGWTIPNPDEEEGGDLLIGLRAPVDTTDAELRMTPCFWARVAGPRPLTFTVPSNDIESPDIHVAALDVPAFVQNPASTGFECFVPVFAIQSEIGNDVVEELVDAARKAWGVMWLAVEA